MTKEVKEKLNEAEDLLSNYAYMSKQLKPCPFCGREALMEVHGNPSTGCYVYIPTCTDKSCAGRLYKKWKTKDLAVNAWNNRATESEGSVSVLIKTMTNLPEHCYDCPCHNGESGYCQADKEHRYSVYRPFWCPLVKINNKHIEVESEDKNV